MKRYYTLDQEGVITLSSHLRQNPEQEYLEEPLSTLKYPKRVGNVWIEDDTVVEPMTDIEEVYKVLVDNNVITSDQVPTNKRTS